MDNLINWIRYSWGDDPTQSIDHSVSLRLEWPFGQALGAALIFLVLLVGAAEGIARLDRLKENPIPLSIGSSHRQFEVKLSKLDDLTRRSGAIDCVFLGSSGIARAIDPQAFQAAYRESTGMHIECFNFGLQGLAPATASHIAEIITKRFHPKLLIYGVDVIGFSDVSGAEAEQSLLEVPWVQYQLGSPTVQGWLVEYSYAIRYYMLFRNWMMRDFFTEIYPNIRMGHFVDAYGYRARTSEGVDVTQPADIDDRPIFGILPGYEISERQRDGLGRLLELNNQTQILVFEVPIHPSFTQFFDSGEREYLDNLGTLENFIGDRNILFWSVWGQLDIPDQAWLNRNHLNHQGAQIFSRWLGMRLGVSVAEGDLTLP